MNKNRKKELDYMVSTYKMSERQLRIELLMWKEEAEELRQEIDMMKFVLADGSPYRKNNKNIKVRR